MKNVKITTIILAIILVTLVAFGGVYIKTQNRMENKVAEYSLGRELNGGRIVELKISTAEGSKPSEEDKTVENYEIAKKTVEQRLKNFGAQDYTISLNKEDGTIRVELPENIDTDSYVTLLTTSVEVEIKEKDGKEVLFNDKMVEKSLYTHTADAEGMYNVYLELYLTKDGQAKIEEIKNNYAILENEVEEIEKAEEEAKKAEEEKKETTETTEEATKTETKTEQTKKIAKLTIGGSEFDIERIEKNKIRLKVGEQTDISAYINSYMNSAAEITALINAGKYPVQYEIANNRLEHSDITNMQMLYFGIAVVSILFIVFLVLTIKYKTKGMLASISIIGFVSILTIILRYTNVSVTIESIGAIILIIIINIKVNQIILENMRNNSNLNEVIANSYKNVFSKLIPIIIIALVFCFAKWSNLISFGTTMFWGLTLIAVYNVIVTKTLLKLKESK